MSASDSAHSIVGCGVGGGPVDALTAGGANSGMEPVAAGLSFPEDLDISGVAPELKKEGSDWFAVFNPKVKRVLDVSLVHTQAYAYAREVGVSSFLF